MIPGMRRFLVAIPAVVIALLSHAGVCPACWPLIGGLISSLGLTVLFETRYLLPLLVGCLAFAVAALGYGARNNYRPLAVGIVASCLILIGTFVFNAIGITVVGACALIAASAWSIWLRRMNTSCQSCCAPKPMEPLEAGSASEATPSTAIPIACSLNQTQFAERKQLVSRLAREALESGRLPNGISVSFEAISDRVSELAKLVDLERACCPFLTFRIEAQAGRPVRLELTGPVAAQEIILELFPEFAQTATQ